MSFRSAWALGFLALAFLGCARDRGADAGAPKRPPVRVAAASDLAPVLERLAPAFEAETGQALAVSLGSTGLLARQLEQGAPFDLFAAAERSFVEPLARSGVCDPATVAEYARGRLVAWPKPGRAAPRALPELADPKFGRIAIANPEHAPYGRAAKEALAAAGVEASLAGRLVLAENVRAAFQFAQTGNVEVSLVSRSLAVMDGTRAGLVLDAALHGPISQTLAVCRRGQSEAGGRALAALLVGPVGQAALAAFGFDPPASEGRGAR